MTEIRFARVDDVDASAAIAATEAAEAARDVAVQAAEDAQNASGNAGADADRAEAAALAAETAQGAAETAQAAAELAETNAETAEAGAVAAQGAAEGFADAADAAQLAAEAAQAAAELAETHAETAEANAEAAAALADADAIATAADRVQTGLDRAAAAGSASAADTSADNAAASAGTATTQAGIAGDEAADAVQSAADAAAAAASLNLGATNLQGGTAGQVPVKQSATDYDFAWEDLPATGVTSVDITAPAAGITFSGGPITTAGAIIAALANDLAALEGIGTTGFAARTATDTWSTRTLTAPAAGFTISNPAGIAGNPTFALSDDLAGLEAIGTVGYMVRTAANTFATRSFTAPAAGFTFTNTAGVSGNTVFSLTNDLAAVEGLAGTGIARRTATDTWTVGTAVANSELATMPTMTVKANITGGTAAPTDTTIASLGALLSPAFVSVAAAEAATIPAATTYIQLVGYTAAGDEGEALYKKAASEPAHALKLQTADGAWWEIAEPEVSVYAAGAVGDGSTNDTAALAAAMAHPKPMKAPGGGSFLSSGLTAISNKIVRGFGRIIRSTAANMLSASGLSNFRLSGWAFDMNRGTVTGDSQGLSFSGNNIKIDDVTVSGFARLAAGGGTGILGFSASLPTRSYGFRLENLTLIGHTNTAATETFGWILADTDYSFASNIYAENIYGTQTAFGHELKNTSSHNNLHGLTTKTGIYGYGQGQQTLGQPGPYANVAMGIVNAQTDRGLFISDGSNNLVSGSVTAWDDSPELIDKAGVFFSRNEVGSLVTDNLVTGAGEGIGVQLQNTMVNNSISAAVHTPDATYLAQFAGADTKGNFLELLHTGTNITIGGKINDTTGNGYASGDANVVHSPSTGERYGSRSGYFHDKLGDSGGATPLTSMRWRHEFNGSMTIGGMTPHDSYFGISHATPTSNNAGGILHYSNGVSGLNYWEIRNLNSTLRILDTDTRPVFDNTHDFGTSGQRFKAGYIIQLRPGAGAVIWTSGAGTPEGNLTAPVGSLYTRTDGGATTTLYVKTSGTGNTGWTAK